MATGKLKRTLTDRSSSPDYLFAPDSKVMVAVNNNFDATRTQVSLRDGRSGKWKRILKGHSSGVWGKDFSPDGEKLATGSRDGTVKLWEVRTGKLSRTLNPGSAVGQVLFSPSGATLASRPEEDDSNNVISLWDVQAGRLLHTVTHQGTLPGLVSTVVAMYFSPDGKTLATASFDDTINLWDVRTGQLKPLVP